MATQSRTSEPTGGETELALTERVGRALARLGLTRHVVHVRGYYAALRAGRVPLDAGWSHELNVEWLRVLRMPPHETDYPVLPRMSPCPGCETSQPFTSMVFPGGSKHQCGGCGSKWLELDP